MESTLQIMPVQRTSRNFGEYAEEAVIIEEPIIKQKRPLFIEANTIEASLEHLRNDCIIPVFAKDNEATLQQLFVVEQPCCCGNDVGLVPVYFVDNHSYVFIDGGRYDFPFYGIVLCYLCVQCRECQRRVCIRAIEVYPENFHI